MTNSTFICAIVATLVLTYGCQQSELKDHSGEIKEHPVEGSWKIETIHWITQDTTFTIEEAQPGMMLFSSDKYALMWTPTLEPRVPFNNLSQPTDEEVIAGFRSVIFNGGHYEVSDSSVVTTAEIAKVPGFEGGKQIYRYQIDQDTMRLTMYDERYPNGDRPQWYGTFETQFVMTRS